MVKIHDFGLMMLPGDSSATGDNSQKPKSKQRAWRPLVDLYGKTFLAKVAHIFIVYHPLKERKSVSVTKHKIWAIEICPKMSLSTPDFTFWAISQDRDAPGQFYLTTRDHHGCRNLGQHQSQIFWIFPRNELLKDLSTMVLICRNRMIAFWENSDFERDTSKVFKFFFLKKNKIKLGFGFQKKNYLLHFFKYFFFFAY